MTDPIKILVVEDDPGCRDVLCEILTRHHYSFHSVDTAREALQRINQEHFDLIFTDLTGVDGLEIVRFIRVKSPVTEVVVLSGDRGSEAVSLRSGANRFLAKPFTVREVLAVARETVEKVRQRSLPA